MTCDRLEHLANWDISDPTRGSSCALRAYVPIRPIPAMGPADIKCLDKHAYLAYYADGSVHIVWYEPRRLQLLPDDVSASSFTPSALQQPRLALGIVLLSLPERGS